MNIYISHSRQFDWKNELYQPIKNSDLANENTLIFPHDNEIIINSKEIFKNNCDLIIAEVSYPSTGQGIELGWANDLNIPIICIYKKGSDIPQSLKKITENFVEYTSSTDLINKIKINLQ